MCPCRRSAGGRACSRRCSGRGAGAVRWCGAVAGRRRCDGAGLGRASRCRVVRRGGKPGERLRGRMRCDALMAARCPPCCIRRSSIWRFFDFWVFRWMFFAFWGSRRAIPPSLGGAPPPQTLFQAPVSWGFLAKTPLRWSAKPRRRSVEIPPAPHFANNRQFHATAMLRSMATAMP